MEEQHLAERFGIKKVLKTAKNIVRLEQLIRHELEEKEEEEEGEREKGGEDSATKSES